MARPTKEEKKEEKKEVVLSDVQKEIWDQVQNLPIEFFGMKEQTIKDVVMPLNLDPSTLYVQLKAPAVLSFLNEALKALKVSIGKEKHQKYVVTQNNKYTSIVPNPDLIHTMLMPQ